MPRYDVTLDRIQSTIITVDADNPDDAIELALNLGLDDERWTGEESGTPDVNTVTEVGPTKSVEVK